MSLTARRASVPLMHCNPSPNVMPAPPFSFVVPCTNMHNEGGIPLAPRVSLSCAIRATPDATRRAAAPVEFGQPLASEVGNEVGHGHAVPLPSPGQNGPPEPRQLFHTPAPHIAGSPRSPHWPFMSPPPRNMLGPSADPSSKLWNVVGTIRIPVLSQVAPFQRTRPLIGSEPRRET